MPQIPLNIVKERAKILREIGNEQLQNYLNNQIGKSTKVLIEKTNQYQSIGKSEYFTNIIINNKIKEGKIVNCIITGTEKNFSKASLIL